MIGHQLFDPWAPHPVVNKHICFGGGGGDEGNPLGKPGPAPSVPDYSQYISDMTATGKQLQGYGKDLYKWAQDAGVKISGIADTVSTRAGQLADQAGQTYSDMMAKWKSTYMPLYDAQAADAQRMIGELPRTEDQYAGKYQADVAQAFDASKDANTRKLQSYGLKAPGSGAQALDNLSANQRGLAQVAAGEQGRLAARTEARQVTGQAIQAGLAFPGIANQASATELSAGNQQIGAPESAISTTTGAYAPYLSSFNASYPFEKAWGDTLATDFNQRLGAYSAENAAKNEYAKNEKGSGMGTMAGGMLGTMGGSFMGGMGGKMGGMMGGGGGGGSPVGESFGSGMQFRRGGAVEPPTAIKTFGFGGMGGGGMGDMGGGMGGGMGSPMGYVTDAIGIGTEFADGDQGITESPQTPMDPAANLWDAASGKPREKYDEAERRGNKVGRFVGRFGSIISGGQGGDAWAEGGGRLGGGIGAATEGDWKGAFNDVVQGTPLTFLRMARGGEARDSNMVPNSASPSDGAITDDVPARLNAGEFVFPKDVVAWRGEQWMQKEIMKARKERDSQTVAEPESAPAGAIDMQAPTFRSEGTQV